MRAAYFLIVTAVLSDVAEALGVTERTVIAALNRAALADVVFELTVRFRLSPDRTCEFAQVTSSEYRAAAYRAHERHRRDLIEQQAAVLARRAGQIRVRRAPVGEPPSPEHRWCTRGMHWIHQDEMGRNSTRKSGYGDWCRECWRVYWNVNVKGRRPPPVTPGSS